MTYLIEANALAEHTLATLTYSGSNSNCKTYAVVTFPTKITSLGALDSTGKKITFNKLTDTTLMGAYDITVAHQSSFEKELTT